MASHLSTDEPDSSRPLLRTGHDPERPAVDSSQAAAALGISRQAVREAIRRRTLDGYGVPGPQRVRWWVYRDALERRRSQPELAERYQELERRHKALQDEVAALQEAMERRERAYRLLRESDEHLVSAVSALRRAFAELDDATSWQSRLTSTLIPDSPQEFEP